MTGRPSIGVVIATHHRPQLLAEALAAVLEQDYDGEVEVVVVFDRSDPDDALARAGRRPVRVVSNSRTPGLTGARNTGILLLETELVAFCDDDDVWLPGKLVAQVDALVRHSGVPFATCAVEVAYGERRSIRLAHATEVEHVDLLRSRMSMLHSSTFVAGREWLVGIGMVDESAPRSQNEDWDLLLRATRGGPLVHVDEPLVRIRWGTSSSFQGQWESRADALRWILDRHPDLAGQPVGYARVLGQLAFAAAVGGHRDETWRYAKRALRQHPTEWRAPVALAVAVGIVGPDRVMHTLHRFGRGV